MLRKITKKNCFSFPGRKQPVYQPDNRRGVLWLHAADSAAHQRHLFPVPGQPELPDSEGTLVVHRRFQLPIIKRPQAKVAWQLKFIKFDTKRMVIRYRI
jgi:hypothetical protein